MKPKTIFHFLLFGIIAILTLCIFLKLIHPGLIREEIRVNNHSELVRYYSGKERLRQSAPKRKIFLTAKYDRISFSDSDDTMAIFFQNDLRGFLSLNTGRVVIPAIYTHAWHFSENMAVVTNDKNQIGIINRKGKLMAPFRYNYIPHATDHLDGNVFSFSDGKCLITDNNNTGLIDSLGNEKLAPVYQNIIFEPKGYYSTLKNDKWGLFDSTYSNILDNEYDNITVLEAGLQVEKDNSKYLASFDGKEIISENIFSDCYPLQYISSGSESSYKDDESEYESDYESDNEPDSAPRLCNGWTVIRKDEGTGLMRNADNKLIINCQYLEIMAISEKLFRCKLDDELFIIRDNNGKVVQF
jgi:hypothetical protein